MSAPPAGALLGRDEAVAEVAALLHVARLVTLTGAPGIGKSRLALGVADVLGNGYPDGPRIVELASIARPDHVTQGVAAALSIDEVSGQSLLETIAARLRRQPALLVLDNCEHLIGSCGELVEALLAGCPELRVLVTGRQRLGLGEERVWQVAPLPVPSPQEAFAPEQIARYAAVLLFLTRAGAVRPGFALSAAVAPAVAEICRRLDGIPLAIELAAARVGSLAPGEIARRLDCRFALLTGGGPNELPRHRTLSAALDWSHDLLCEGERALLRRMSVFVGELDLEAAVAICSGEAFGACGHTLEDQVPELLARLVAKSLVVAGGDGSRRARYRLLETVRAYAGERLEEAGEARTAHAAHARFHLELAERAEPELTGPCQEHWLERLEEARANLRSALEWSLADGEAESALRLGGALVLFWRVRCHFSEGHELLEATLAATEDAPEALRAKALWGRAFMSHMAGNTKAAVPALRQALDRFREAGDRQGSARALLVLANCRQFRADPAAVTMLEESARLARDAGDWWCLGHALALAGFEHLTLSRLHEARPLFERSLEVARAAGDKQALRFGLIGFGSLCVGQGDYAAAQSALEEAMAVTDELGEDYGRATALRYLGELELGRGEYAGARESLRGSIALFAQSSSPERAVEPLTLLARRAAAMGDGAEARRLFEEAIAMAGKGVTVTPPLQGLGELAAAEGDVERARELLERARDLARGIGDKRSVADALHALGRLARTAGSSARARALFNEALELRREVGEAPAMVASLEALGGLAAAAGRHRHAARLLGAAQALRDGGGYARPPSDCAAYEADLARVRAHLPHGAVDGALAEGAGLSLDAAVTQALKGRRRRGRPTGGWESLTDREQEVAALVAQGLTNREVGERLFLTTGTVKSHLSHIFEKLGMTSRRELEREMLLRGAPERSATPAGDDRP